MFEVNHIQKSWLQAAALLLTAYHVHASGNGPTVDFNRDIRPILSNNCFYCHGPDEKERKGGKDGLRLDTESGQREDLGGYAAVVPGKPESSEIIKRIITDDEDDLMPPKKSGKKISPHELDLLKKWIAEGAKFTKHWSYEKLSRPSPPEVRSPKFTLRNDIDRFVLAKLESMGLQPQPEADRYSLARRVALDLTGLPPSLEEADAFVNDKTPDAYERFVDRMLAKPAYGEHWARMWLDLARYADSAGYADDPARTIWAYRDYVIRSLNQNKPFDQFTLEQLAGDLIPNATEEQVIATAFHRNTMTNNEGGTVDEEFRNAAIVDRVNTTMAVWMGTSMACAQCHTHKFDPITNKEYFQFFAFLNNTADSDKHDESPLLDFSSADVKAKRAALKKEEATLDSHLKKGAKEKLDEDEKKTAETRRAKVRKSLSELPTFTVPVMRELTSKERRKTHVQVRGNYLVTADEVSEGVPSAWHPLPKDAPRDRLTLAHWLVDKDNPLTPRVIANRFWEQIFGLGIVRTSEEFGSQGELPVNQELLDWLACELMATKWDMKRFLRLLVTSSAYRQSSHVTPEALEKDPENRFLSRGPRFRLSAEMVRDQALMASGLLSAKMYGPSVRPVQPSLGLSAAFGGNLDWQTSKGEDAHRRGIYTEWRRSSPYPSMTTFDAPNRESCTLRRNCTNTPLQALVTMNDPVFIETAQALARRMVQKGGSAEEKARFGFRSCIIRPPSDAETKRLVKMHSEALAHFQANPAKAKDLATNPIGPEPQGTDIADLAAWTTVANVLLNLDETLMKR